MFVIFPGFNLAVVEARKGLGFTKISANSKIIVTSFHVIGYITQVTPLTIVEKKF